MALRLGVVPASLYSRVDSVDDLYDLGFDQALAQDLDLQRAIDSAPLHELMLVYYRHLVAHPWASQVIAMRAPRGPNYLRFSEQMCALLSERGSADPLGDAYALSNFVIGSATTTPMAGLEREAPIDAETAPLYASLHADHGVDAESILRRGLHALLSPG